MFATDSTFFSGAERVFSYVVEDLSRSHPGSIALWHKRAEAHVKSAVPNWAEIPVEWRFEGTQLKLKLNEAARIAAMMKNKGIRLALVNMWSPYSNTLTLLACRMARVPAIAVFHYYQERSDVRGPLRSIKLSAYRLACRLSWRIVTVSEAHRGVLMREFGYPPHKLVAIHNGVPLPTEAPVRSYGSARRFLTVGSLERRKGVHELLPALAKAPGEWTLDLAGDGPDRPMLQAMTNEHGLYSKVRFLGRCSSMDAIYRQAEVLLHPSLSENLSMAILEAMSHGLPVIANDLGGNPELVTSGSEGWLATAGAKESWVTALNEAILGRDLHKMSRNARTRVELEFNLDAMLSAYRELVSKALA